VDFVRSRRQPETGVHFCSDRIVSSALASTQRVGVRAIGEWKERAGAVAEARFDFRTGITSVVLWLVVVREQRRRRSPCWDRRCFQRQAATSGSKLLHQATEAPRAVPAALIPREANEQAAVV
jgi:hypothetical protein